MQAEIRSARAAEARFGMNFFVPDPAQAAPTGAVRAELEEYRAR
jgi:nitronate monooxygenase